MNYQQEYNRNIFINNSSSNDNTYLVGPTGPRGIQGSAGFGIHLIGAAPTANEIYNKETINLKNGDSIMNHENHHLYVYNVSENGNSWIDAGEIQGPQGIEGEQGIQGELGPTGPRGYRGYTGHTGPRGYTGYRGYTGHTGPRGYTGHSGHTGPTGPQGIQGDQGLNGPTGPIGPIGNDGGIVNLIPEHLIFNGDNTQKINKKGPGNFDIALNGISKLAIKDSEIKSFVDINCNDNFLENVKDPTEKHHGVNKGYVDDLISLLLEEINLLKSNS